MNYCKIKKNKDYQKLFHRGKRAFASSLTILYEKSNETGMGICIGKKHGKSVQRNRIKRLLRAAFSPESDKLKDVNLLLIPKVSEEYSFRQFQKDMQYIFRKEKLYKE